MPDLVQFPLRLSKKVPDLRISMALSRLQSFDAGFKVDDRPAAFVGLAVLVWAIATAYVHGELAKAVLRVGILVAFVTFVLCACRI